MRSEITEVIGVGEYFKVTLRNANIIRHKGFLKLAKASRLEHRCGYGAATAKLVESVEKARLAMLSI